MQITFSCLWGAFKYRNSVMQYKLHETYCKVQKRYQRRTEIQIIYHEIRWLVPIVPCNHFCWTNVGNLLLLRQFGRAQLHVRNGFAWSVMVDIPHD